MFIMKSQSGVLCHVNNSRRAVYGYDQRVEIFGSKGMMVSDNQSPTSVKKYTNKIANANEPAYYFFIERYQEAYKLQLDDLVRFIKNNSKPLADFEDGRRSLILAENAIKSLKTKKFEKVKFN